MKKISLVLLILSAALMLVACASMLDAVKKGDAKTVSKMVAEKKDVNIANKYGDSPLHMAIYKKRPDIAAILLNAGADIEAKTKKGRTPLMEAARVDCMECLKLLIEKGADVNIEAPGESSALMSAAKKNNMEAVDLLLVHGADPTVQNAYGITPLMSAFQSSYDNRPEMEQNERKELIETDPTTAKYEYA